jgi:hypothetical protein
MELRCVSLTLELVEQCFSKILNKWAPSSLIVLSFIKSAFCYTSYCMRFHIVIFITLMEICSWYLGALDQLGGIHLHGAPSLHCIGSFDGGLWFGGVSLLLGWMIVLAGLVVFSHVLALLITPWLHI